MMTFINMAWTLITSNAVMMQKATAILMAFNSSLVFFVFERFGLAIGVISFDTTAILIADNFSSYSMGVAPSSPESGVSAILSWFFWMPANSFSSLVEIGD